jgi:hypothetical protein
VPSLCVLGGGPTPVLRQEQGQMAGRRLEIRRVQGAQQRVVRHTSIELSDQPLEERHATDRVVERDFVLHGGEVYGRRPGSDDPDQDTTGDQATTEPPSTTRVGSSAFRSCTQIPARSPIRPGKAKDRPSGDQSVIVCAYCPKKGMYSRR